MKQQQFGSVVVVEDETKSDGDIALVVHGHTLLMYGFLIHEHPTI